MNYSSEGFFLLGMAVGLLLGGFSTYGFIFAWAMRYGKSDREREEEEEE
jgi:hypothetical protein